MSLRGPQSERRASALELRAQGRKLEGYAALFDREAQIGTFRETIRGGAFSRSLRGKPDILALVDHDPTALLGRTSSGTLRLSEDTTGLHFEIDLPRTTPARDILELAERGDLGGMSFGFTMTEERWTGELRELVAVKLHEISVVQAWPAYDGTIVTARSASPLIQPSHGLRLKLLEIGL